MKDPQADVGESLRVCLCDVAQSIRTEQGIISYGSCRLTGDRSPLDAKEMLVNRIVYIVGAIVIIVPVVLRIAVEKRTHSAECASARVSEARSSAKSRRLPGFWRARP